MKKGEGMTKKKRISIRMLFSYLVIILAPAVAILVIYITMQGALLDIQKEKVQNLLKEAAVTFNKEVEQLDNVAKYIVTDGNLKRYMNEDATKTSPENYYRAYELAKSYPDYAILNRFIKNIYIFPLKTSYLIQIPRVVPNNHLGMTIIDIVANGTEYEEMVQTLYGLEKNGLICKEDISEKFLIVQRFDYRENGEKAGVVVIELAEKEIKNLLSRSLGVDTGMAFLMDEDGRILYVYDSINDIYEAFPEITDWEEYVDQYGRNEKMVTTEKVSTQAVRGTILTVMRKQELLSKVGAGKYIILVLCVASLMIGVAICLWYWNRNQPVVEQYLRFSEKYPNYMLPQEESTDIWKNFGGVLSHVDDLQMTLERQKQWLQEVIIRKILYGVYDSDQELLQELKKGELEFPIMLPCILVGLELEHPMKQETELSVETLEQVLKEELDKQLPDAYRMINMGSLSYILLVDAAALPADGREIKLLFGEINYEVYSRVPVTIFTGIGNEAGAIAAITEEYEHVCRICEYAKYYKLRIPCLLEELPRHQHMVFTVELEIQLEKTIKNGTQEQLKAIMEQVEENYLYMPGKEYLPASYNQEVLRCILLRCLEDSPKEKQQGSLIEEIHSARTPEEVEAGIWHVWEYFEERRILCQDQDLEALKEKIETYMEREYSRAEFNLAMMAGLLEMPEKKLYHDFKKMYGVSFSSSLEMKRIRYAQEFLKEKRSIGEVAQAVGYSSDYSFRRAFKRVVGVTPSDYQKMQENDN